VAFRLSSAARGARAFAQFAKPRGLRSRPHPIYVYDRLDEPVRGLLEDNLAAAEGAATAVTFASGMAAVAAALLVTARSGDEVVAHPALYGCTHSLLTQWMPRFGVTARFADLRDPARLRRAIRPATRVVYLETPVNPTLTLLDLDAIVAVVRRANRGRPRSRRVLVVVDNTFATPLGQRPLAHGADLVVASLTKHLSGFGTDLGGMVAGGREWERPLFLVRKDFGGVLAAKNAWPILVYGLSTLSVRLRAQEERALEIARFLEAHPMVERVSYPGLASFRQGALARRQMTDLEGRFRPGTLVYFVLKGSPRAALEAARRVVDHVAHDAYALTLAVSLGQVRTLVEHPASMTHAALPAAARARAGIDAGGIRVSVGLEDPRDLVADLSAALSHAGRRAAPIRPLRRLPPAPRRLHPHPRRMPA
jgi:cystathionine beta-lyase/cystathionine gamma-synthase